ncbi:MAG: hypothetical protein IKB95_08075 [Bacteroidales bacterium]|nr:hypothetical protein [Bacteroidales bacterium]
MNYNPVNSSHRSLGWVKFTFVLFLLIFVGFVNKAVGQEAYAVESPDKTTLTFYYDTQRTSRTGTVYNLNTGTNHPGWTPHLSYSSFTTVIFTEDFKNARPTTCNEWFYNLANLTSIIGLEYLNTSEVTNMYYMFGGYGCYWSSSAYNFGNSYRQVFGSVDVVTDYYTSLYGHSVRIVRAL